MKIHHMIGVGDKAAFVRYRVRIPGAALRRMGHRVTYSSEDENVTVPDITVVHKFVWTPELEAFLDHARDAGSRVAFDICDDHFEHPERGAAVRNLAAVADVLTVPTEVMRDIVWDQLGRDARVVEDPYEYPEVAPRFAPQGEPRLMWYGHINNLKALVSVWPSLDGCRIAMVTDTETMRKAGIPLTVVDWSRENMVRVFNETDMVILPVELHKPRKLAKSTNRMVEAIRQGRFVVASPLPAYQQFAEWMWLGDIREGVDWAVAHPDEVLDRIKKAQDYVREKFSPDTIANKWLEVFNET